MKTSRLHLIALAASLFFSAGAMAESLSKSDYKVGKTRISAEYKTDKAACDALSGQPKDLCVVQAKGKEKVARADLEVRYKSTPKTRYEAHAAKADADHAVAMAHCDELAGNAKDVCAKEAKSVQTTLKADAKARMKTTDANVTAGEKATDARKDATADKLKAQYDVAKEKCGSQAGDAKTQCLERAKADFGKL